MKLVDIPTYSVFPFHVDTEGPISIGDMHKNYDWKKSPPIPIYRIPGFLRFDQWKHILVDGNTRWILSHCTSRRIRCILYDAHELPDVARDGIAPAKNLGHKNLYLTTLKIYCHLMNKQKS